MKFYNDTELDNDIKYVKEAVSRCAGMCRSIKHNAVKLNQIILSRTEFIFSQFKCVFN